MTGETKCSEQAASEPLDTEKCLLADVKLVSPDWVIRCDLCHAIVVEVARGRVDPIDLMPQPLEKERVTGGAVPAPGRHTLWDLACSEIECDDPRKVGLPIIERA
eukprot:scaffold38846_cov197-Isochrysis_galbana.AAC.1